MVDQADVVVIGAGPGGYVAAISCAQFGLKTVCIDNNAYLGGTCLRVGCIPSKTLLHATQSFAFLKSHGQEAGIEATNLNFDFGQMMQNKERVVEGLARGIDFLFRKNKVTRIQGKAILVDPHTIEVNGSRIQARYIILATGSEPIALPFLSFDEKKVLSSTGALALPSPPSRMLVVGSGVVGLELGSVYQRLGTQVTVIELLDHICPSLDATIALELKKSLEAEGVIFHLSARVKKGQVQDKQITLDVEMNNQTVQSFAAEAVLVAIGRRPSSCELGLQALGIQKDEKGFVKVDHNLRTNHSHIYAIGDLIDGPMLAHKASEEGMAVAKLIAGHSAHINYLALPVVVYTSPEAAGVGLTQEEAKRCGLEVKVGTFPFKANSRACCTGQSKGLVKLIADRASDRLVGMHLLCSHASEMIGMGVLALEQKMTIHQLANVPYAHPTLSEAIKEAALATYGHCIHI